SHLALLAFPPRRSSDLDLLRIHVLPEEGFRAGQELVRPPLCFGIRLGRRVDQIQSETTEEQLAHETGLDPILLAGGFGDCARLPLADLHRRAHGAPPDPAMAAAVVGRAS